MNKKTIKLSLVERRQIIANKVMMKYICRQCYNEIEELNNLGLTSTIEEAEQILANHQCKNTN